MEETIDVGTGLPVGAQPTPVGAYDFTSGLQSMQDMLDKIAKGQANRAIQQQKDKKEFDELTITKPTVWKQDDEYINEALKAYEDALKAASAGGVYDQDKWTEAQKKAIRDAEAELERRAAEAKANQKYYEEAHEIVDKSDDKTYDKGWFNTWGTEYLADSSVEGSKKRIEKRLSSGDDDSPYQRPYTIDDVVQKYKVFETKEVGGKRITHADKEAIYKRILEGTKSGIGKRMYELNRETDQETPEQFARRVAEMSPEMLMDSETRLRQAKAKEDDGFNEMGIKPEFDFKNKGEEATYADQDTGKTVNSVHYVKKGGGSPEVNIAEGSMEHKYSISFITKTADNRYYLFGRKDGMPLSRPVELSQANIATINANLGVDVITDVNRAILEGRKARWASYQ